jgi:hypothetical protein
LYLKNIPLHSQIEVFDLIGLNLTNQVIIGQEEMDVSRLKPGAYFLKLSGDKGSIVKRFVKK